MAQIEFGKTYYPPKRELIVTDNSVTGPGWKVERLGEEFIFEFLAARHGGGVDRYKVTAEEFEELKLGRLSFEELLRKYDVN